MLNNVSLQISICPSFTIFIFNICLIRWNEIYKKKNYSIFGTKVESRSIVPPNIGQRKFLTLLTKFQFFLFLLFLAKSFQLYILYTVETRWRIMVTIFEIRSNMKYLLSLNRILEILIKKSMSISLWNECPLILYSPFVKYITLIYPSLSYFTFKKIHFIINEFRYCARKFFFASDISYIEFRDLRTGRYNNFPHELKTFDWQKFIVQILWYYADCEDDWWTDLGPWRKYKAFRYKINTPWQIYRENNQTFQRRRPIEIEIVT